MLQNTCHKRCYAKQRLPGPLCFERKIAFSGLFIGQGNHFLPLRKVEISIEWEGEGIQIWYLLVRAEQGFPLCPGGK